MDIQSELSIERTRLANHRTLLAYFRSSIALIVSGAGLLKFIHDDIWVYTGYILLGLAPVMIIAGLVDFIRMKRLIKKEIKILKGKYNG